MGRSQAGDRLRLLTVFIAVVDACGFAAAARRLGVSPATVTRAIADLEQQLGAQVLVRTTRSIRLTEAGSRYAEDCRRILHRLDQAEAAIKGLPQAADGHLVVAAPASLAGRCMVPIVSSYLARYPEAGITCLFLERDVSIIDEGVDVALRIGSAFDIALQAVPVGVLRQVICAAPCYLGQHGVPHEPNDLRGHHVIGTPAADAQVHWQLRRGAEALAVRLSPRLATNSPDAALQLAVAGLGVARLNHAQVQQALASGALVSVLDGYEPAPLPVNLLHREGRFASSRARAFLDIAVAALRAEPGFQP
jgi:DNA-binding transcriptional LysR family regulator